MDFEQDEDFAEFRRALATDRQTLLDFLRDLALPREPVGDYITDIEKCCTLFGELQELHSVLGIVMPAGATLALFMVAPITGVRAQLRELRNALSAEYRTDRVYGAMRPCMFWCLLLPTCLTRANILRAKRQDRPDVRCQKKKVVSLPDDPLRSWPHGTEQGRSQECKCWIPKPLTTLTGVWTNGAA